MRAHLFVDGGGMVTGTQDKLAAQQAMVDEYLDTMGAYDDGEEVLHALRTFNLAAARLEVGRVVPNNRETGDPDYAWWWRTGYTLGKPGVTRAVVWYA